MLGIVPASSHASGCQKLHRLMPSNRSSQLQEAIEHAICRFQDRLSALERECQIFRTFAGWKDVSHLARARDLLRELEALERQLMTDTSYRLQPAFQRHHLLLRYQTFKRTFRQFWEDLTG